MDLSWNFTCLVGYILISIVIAQQCQAPDLQSCSSCYYQGAATLSTTQANQNSYIVIGGLFDIHKIGNNAFCGTEYSEEGLINSLVCFFLFLNWDFSKSQCCNMTILHVVSVKNKSYNIFAI